jgi:hypothetical protein
MAYSRCVIFNRGPTALRYFGRSELHEEKRVKLGDVAMADDTIQRVADPKGVVPSILFNGAGSQDQAKLSQRSTQPDSNGAAGYGYYAEFINLVYSVYDKQTGTLVAPRVTDTQFWQSAGIPRPSNIVDPRIVFIPDAGRNGQWLAVQLDLGNRVLIATTDPHDPQSDPRVGKWKASVFDLPGNDFSMLGYDLNGIYIGVNSEAAPGQDRWPQIVFIPRANALAWPPQVGSDVIKIMGPLSKYQYGENLYPMIDQSGAGWPYATAIGVDNVAKSHLTFSLISAQFGQILSHGKIEVPAFEPAPMGFRVKQPGAYQAVWWYGGSIISAPTGGGFNIWLAQTVLKGSISTGALAVRWYRLYIDPMTRMPGLAATGEIYQEGYDHFNPSILSFGKDDYTVISLSRSGSSNPNPSDPACGNLGAYVALVRETSSGSTSQVFPVRSGLVPNYIMQIPNPYRWGDYSTISRDPDPAYPRRVWIVNQYALQGGQNTSAWCDAIAAIDVPQPTDLTAT